jgi:DNA repair protein RecO (recombination protein O)
MSQEFQRAEGIILRVIPFRDYDQILTLFTQEAGLIKVLYKGSRSKRRGLQGVCLPLNKVEVVYREKNSEIFICQEMTLLDSYAALRRTLSHLEAACDLLQVMARSQLVGKAAPQLYALLCFYLRKIPLTPDLKVSVLSFRLKLLIHEGLANFPLLCSACCQELHPQAYLHHAEWWCEQHHALGSTLWTADELQVLYGLATSQSYQDIFSYSVTGGLQGKMMEFFERRLQNAS